MLIFQFHHYVKEEFVESYREAILTNARASVKEPGIVRFDVFQDRENPSHFSLLEIYVNQAARDAHFETEHFKAWYTAVIGQDMFARRGSGDAWEPVFLTQDDSSQSGV